MEKMNITYIHHHSKVCDDFALALQFKTIGIINNEALIKGEFPEGATVGNIFTSEKSNIADYMCSMALKYCPFCGKKLHKPTDQAVYEQCDICNHHDHDYSDIEESGDDADHDYENDHYCTLKETCTNMDHFQLLPKLNAEIEEAKKDIVEGRTVDYETVRKALQSKE